MQGPIVHGGRGTKATRRGLGSRAGGFTLIELVIAIAITVVALLGASAMLFFGSTNVNYSGGISQATGLAQRRLPFPTLVGMVTAADPPNAPVSSLETITGTDNTAFTIRTWVQIVAGTAAPRREATVTVTTGWTEPTGGKSVRLDTLVAE
jgi:prepilin-type N-terminal cleavage/methylation domain-containing protein